jgi:hypothetical protein
MSRTLSSVTGIHRQLLSAIGGGATTKCASSTQPDVAADSIAPPIRLIDIQIICAVDGPTKNPGPAEYGIKHPHT